MTGGRCPITLMCSAYKIIVEITTTYNMSAEQYQTGECCLTTLTNLCTAINFMATHPP